MIVFPTTSSREIIVGDVISLHDEEAGCLSHRTIAYLACVGYFCVCLHTFTRFPGSLQVLTSIYKFDFAK